LLAFSGYYLASIFTEEQIVIENVINYLLIIPLSYTFQCIAILACPFFISIGKPNTALVIVFFRFIGFLVPLAYIGKTLYGIVGLFVGITISNVLIGLLSFYLSNKSLKEFNFYSMQPREENM
jgi:Na+-driven multidrug efflux pump